MANIDSQAFVYGPLDVDQVEPHPFGEPVTMQTIQRDLQEIGSLASWTSKYEAKSPTMPTIDTEN